MSQFKRPPKTRFENVVFGTEVLLAHRPHILIYRRLLDTKWFVWLGSNLPASVAAEYVAYELSGLAVVACNSCGSAAYVAYNSYSL